MTPLVVDASVAVKWCVHAYTEPLAREAEDLLAAYRSAEVQFVVPDLFWLELANALWKAVRNQKTNMQNAERSLLLVADLEIPTMPTFDLVPRSLQLAAGNDRTVYDSVYLALALRANADLITADERLANVLAARFPVKWLGAY